MIFQQLEGEDLLNCEAVCRQWREILLAGTPWRSLFHRNKDRSPLWRKAQKSLEKNQRKLRTDEYRDVCKEIMANQNWHTGNCTKLTYASDVHSATFISISDDYVAWNFFRLGKDGYCRKGCFFLDTGSMEIEEIPVFCHCKPWTICYHMHEMYVNEMLLFWRVGDSVEKLVEIVNPNNRWVVDVLEGFNDGETEEVEVKFAFGSQFLVTYIYPICARNWERIRIWKMGNPPVLLKELACNFRNLEIMKVDEQFIVARTQFTRSPTLYFISTETLKEKRSRILINKDYIYDRALLFQYCDNGIVRILDVASGAYFNDVRLPFQGKYEPFMKLLQKWASSNSKCIVIGRKYSGKFRTFSHLSVYDLESVKKPNSACLLLYTLQFKSNIDSFVMNESEIAFNGSDTCGNQKCVTVLKFANFSFAEKKPSDLKENRKGNGDSKNKVVKVEMIKFFGDRVDFDKEGKK